MLYLIGLGLNAKGISVEGIKALQGCTKVYLECYTVDFPYSLVELEKELGKKIEKLERKDVESDRLIKEARKEDIALLVYGCPVFATTHNSLISDGKKENIEVKVIYSSSVFDAVSATGLQLYKFGKITSMPDWKFHKNKPDSFIEVVKDNLSIKAHSLILVDIGLDFKDALQELEEASMNKNLKLDKIVVCSRLGTKDERVYYNTLEVLKKKAVQLPFCLIIPSEMHFLEKECLERFD